MAMSLSLSPKEKIDVKGLKVELSENYTLTVSKAGLIVIKSVLGDDDIFILMDSGYGIDYSQSLKSFRLLFPKSYMVAICLNKK